MKRNLKCRYLATTAVLLLFAAIAIPPLQVRAADESYQLIENWAQLPEGTHWGVMSGVGVDTKGNVYTLQREDAASNASSEIIVVDSKGKYLRTWGVNEFPGGHSLRVYNDSVWVADKKLQQVLKYDTNGKPLLALGQKNVSGNNTSEDSFNGTSDIAIAKDGDIFVSDGEGANARIVKFSRDRKFIKFWGTRGSGPGQFQTPHNLAIDSKGNVWVCDSGNKRLQVFDQDGNFISQTTQFGAPHVLFITKDDVMYVAATAPENRITIGTTDGKILGTVGGLNGPAGIAVDRDGAIYVAEIAGNTVLKYAKK